MSFDKALAFTFGWEGGFSNSKKDPGGATMFGVTQKAYSEWRREKGLGVKFVRGITHEEAIAIYRQKYWFAGRCDAMPELVAIAHFDFAVNAGVGRAAEQMQYVLDVKADVAIGPKTLQAIALWDERRLVAAYLDQRVNYYKFDKRIGRINRTAHLKGWLNRTNDLRKKLLA